MSADAVSDQVSRSTDACVDLSGDKLPEAKLAIEKLTVDLAEHMKRLLDELDRLSADKATIEQEIDSIRLGLVNNGGEWRFDPASES